MSKLTTNYSNQIKVTLPQELHGFIKSKADRFGLTVSAYLKNLIIDDVKDLDMPTFTMSKKREKIALNASKDFKDGKTKKITNIDSYLNSL